MCHYHCGSYTEDKDYGSLDECLRKLEQEKPSNRIYYLALPPDLFARTAQCAARCAPGRGGGWTRVVVEKPFGRDLESSRELSRGLTAALPEVRDDGRRAPSWKSCFSRSCSEQ